MKKLLLPLLLLAMSAATFAQEAIRERRPTGSPQFNDDGTVTFRLRTPEAKKVTIAGDFIHRHAEMEAQDGIWTYTTPSALPPDMYYYRFYVDGVEMLDPANVERCRDVRSFMSTFVLSRQKGDRGYLYAPQDVPHGTVSQVWYPSPTLGMDRRMTIYTPPGYEQGGKYPVLYLLHGAGGDEEAWTTLGRTAYIMDNLIALGQAEPMIVVMPNGNANQESSPYWRAKHIEKPLNSFPESFPDIMQYMKKNYRIRTGARNTAICGLSMGGYHTFAVSNLLPGTFNYIGLFSAAIRMGRGDTRDICTYLEEEPGMADKIKKVFEARPALYWIAIGKDDFLLAQNNGLRQFLDKKQYPYEYFENEDGHIWRNWRIYLTDFAQRLFKEENP